MNTAKSLLLASLLLGAGDASAQSVDQAPEPVAIVELGGAAGWDLNGGGSSFGPNLAVEVTPIEKWLELEAGATALFRRHSTEWDTDLLFKKPWTLSEKVEFMAGIGPEWIHTRADGVTSNSLGGEVVLDFMFWPSAKHRFGWYLEPGYEYSFGRGPEGLEELLRLWISAGGLWRDQYVRSRSSHATSETTQSTALPTAGRGHLL